MCVCVCVCVWSTVLGCGGILNREQERASAAETMFGPHRALRLVVVVVVVVPAAASFAGKRKHGDSTCWTALGEKNIPNVVEADCKHRFQSLREAMAVCEKLDGCEGVVRDGGVHCPAAYSEHTSIWPGGFAPVFLYDLRKGKAGHWPGGQIRSWALDRSPGCRGSSGANAAAAELGPNEVHHYRCEAHATATVKERLTSDEFADGLAASGALERRSAAEVAVIDEEEVASGACPSLSTKASSLATPAAAAASAAFAASAAGLRCGAVRSLAEQLGALPATDAQTDSCGRTDLLGAQTKCVIGHDGRDDGWGGQHFRRVSAPLPHNPLGAQGYSKGG